MAFMFSTCDPCCGSCQITLTVTDLCRVPMPGAYVTITQKGSQTVLDKGYTTDTGIIVLKPSSYGWYTITVTMNGYQTTSIDVYACDACNCFIPKTLYLFASINLSRQKNYFYNVSNTSPEPNYYNLTYDTRPVEIPNQLEMISYNSSTGDDSTATPGLITMPDEGWFSDKIPGKHLGADTNFYFYLWISQCTAKVMVIDISGDGKYKAGAASSIATYSLTQCHSPCICPYVPTELAVSVDMSARVWTGGTTYCLPQTGRLTYQEIPDDISQFSDFMPINLAEPDSPPKGWYSNIIMPQTLPYNYKGTITIPAFRYYFTCNAAIGYAQKFGLYGLPLKGQLIPLDYAATYNMISFGNFNSAYLPGISGYSCNPFQVTGFGATTNGWWVPVSVSGSVGNDAIEMSDFVMTRTQDSTTILGTHGSDDLEPDKDGNVGGYS